MKFVVRVLKNEFEAEFGMDEMWSADNDAVYDWVAERFSDCVIEDCVQMDDETLDFILEE